MWKKSEEKIISEFIVGTCQLLPVSHDAISEPPRFRDVHVIRCGSSVEFYIRPMNLCINDIDTLTVPCYQLAFEEDFPVLPNDVSRLRDTIQCFRMEPYLRYPGFVRLRIWGEMNCNWKYKTFEFSHTSDPRKRYIRCDLAAAIAARHLLTKRFREELYTVTGPAVKTGKNATGTQSDNVTSLWCPRWPKEAQSWTNGHRNQGWPTVATISEVVQQGCHLVYVQHRACRNDQLQWRLSFSVAEVILLQSWTKIQQIVYHMLRFFSKRELIQKDFNKEDEVLCTYHLKTLMLWSCEEMPPEWWNSSSVITICCELLQKLSGWLKRKHCPNYFIPEANLFHERFNSTNLDEVERQLNKFCKSGILCQWFMRNYILPVILTYFGDGHIVNISGFLKPLIEYRNTLQSDSLDLLFYNEFTHCNIYTRRSNISHRIHLRSILIEMRAMREFQLVAERRMSMLPMPVDISCFTFFDKTVYCLNTAYSLVYGEISWDSELFEYVRGIFWKPKIVRCQYHIFPEPLTAQISQCQFLRAQEMMENLTGTNSRSECQLLSVMSIECLRKALECDDFQSNGIAAAALVYLAALHFASAEYQIVIDICSEVLMCQTIHTVNETLNAGCLFFIDDVARIVGSSLVCKKFNENMHFSKRQNYLDLRTTPKVFAYYLTVTCAERTSTQIELISDLPTSAFPLDQFLMAFAKHKTDILTKSCTCLKTATQCVYQRADSVTRYASLSLDSLIVKENLIDYLTEFALENMTSFFSVIHKHFGIHCNTADCYRALYLYKCRQYGEVLHLCEEILKEPDLQSELRKFAFGNVLVMTPFDSFFDRDVQSLLGFHTLLHFLSPLNDDLRKFKLAAQFFDQFLHVDSLLKHYSVTSFHFLGRHFLARYLKLRCYMDCNYPCRNELSNFCAGRSSLPFEHIIRRFLRQKHHEVD